MVDRSYPVKVYGLKGDVVSLSLGETKSCAIKKNGEVWCWGGGYPPKTIRIDGLGDGVKAVSVGGSHVCAITASGGVKCWGSNYSGELGDGTAINRDTPVDVVGLASGVKEIGAGDGRTCALTNEGTVKCWGTYWKGPMGVLVNSNMEVIGRKELSHPVEILGLTGIQSLAVGSDHVCVITESGGIKCWGQNDLGQLGDGTNDDPGWLRSYSGWPPVPKLVDTSGLGSGVKGLSAGYSHTCAWLEEGAIKCWGKNDNGQLGNGATIDSNTPVDPVDLQDEISMIAGGENHTCALTTEGKGKCWGSNISGQLGLGTIFMRKEPVEVPGLGSGVKSMSASREYWWGDHTCAVTATGGVKCWGVNGFGQLGDGTTINRGSPVDVVGLSTGVQAVASGSIHTCALTVEGRVICWGGMYDIKPIEIDSLDDEVIAIAAGDYHTCALTKAGGVKCWGSNFSGQLGNGGSQDSLKPVDVLGMNKGVMAIAAGGSAFTCALTEQGSVKCWGNNQDYQLGEGNEPCGNIYRRSIKKPVPVVGLDSGIISISAGITSSCAVIDTGGVKCWGQFPPNVSRSGGKCNKPGDVEQLPEKMITVAIGGTHICGITTGGGVLCWGFNDFGQLGNGSLEESCGLYQPDRYTHEILCRGDFYSKVSGLSKDVLALTAGNAYSCALTKEGIVKCWGADNYGQLGQGTLLQSPTPVDVLLPSTLN